MTLHVHDLLPDRTGPFHRLDPRSKILASFSLVLACVSTPQGAHGSFLGYALLLFVGILVSRVPVHDLLRRILALVPFLAVVTLSVILWGPEGGTGFSLVKEVLVKSTLAVTALTWLSLTTPFPNLLQGLEKLKVPPVFVGLLGFTIRYVPLLLREVVRMKRARDSRSFGGRWICHASVVGHMIGVLFLRTAERGERIYQAMVSRGFLGRLPGPASGRGLQKWDFAFLGGTGVLLASLWGVAVFHP